MHFMMKWICAAFAALAIASHASVASGEGSGTPAAPAGTFAVHLEHGKCYQTEHFTVCYDNLRQQLAAAGQPEEPAYVKAIGDELEKIWSLYDSWDLKTPKQQVVFLYPVAHGWDYIVGPARGDTLRPEVAGEAAKTGHMSIGCILPGDRLVPIAEMKRTLAHEYFHRVQMQYYKLVGPDAYVREGTAGLIEILAYPELAEDTVMASGTMTPVKFDSLTLTDQGDEAMSFFLYLTRRFGRDIVRKMFVAYGGLTATTRSAIESAVKESGGASETLETLFSDFSDDFFASFPPKDPLYPVLRTDRRKMPLFITHNLGSFQSSILQVDDIPPMTAKYYLCESPKPVLVKARLTSDQAGIVARIYSVTTSATTYVCMLGKGGSTETPDKIFCGGDNQIGVLVTNRGTGASGAVIEFSLEEVKTGFLEGDTQSICPRFVPGFPGAQVVEKGGGTPADPMPNMQAWSTIKNEYKRDDMHISLFEYKTNQDAVKDLTGFSKTLQDEIEYNQKLAARPSTGSSEYKTDLVDRSRFVDNKESIANWKRTVYRGEKVHEQLTYYNAHRIYRGRFMVSINWMQDNTAEDPGPVADAMFKNACELIDKRFPDHAASMKP